MIIEVNNQAYMIKSPSVSTSENEKVKLKEVPNLF